MHHQFIIQQLYALPHTVFMCFVFSWEQTATCATYSINWLVFITQMKSVSSVVRTGALNTAVCASSLNGLTEGWIRGASYKPNLETKRVHTLYFAIETSRLQNSARVQIILIDQQPKSVYADECHDGAHVTSRIFPSTHTQTYITLLITLFDIFRTHPARLKI